MSWMTERNKYHFPWIQVSSRHEQHLQEKQDKYRLTTLRLSDSHFITNLGKTGIWPRADRSLLLLFPVAAGSEGAGAACKRGERSAMRGLSSIMRGSPALRTRIISNIIIRKAGKKDMEYPYLVFWPTHFFFGGGSTKVKNPPPQYGKSFFLHLPFPCWANYLVLRAAGLLGWQDININNTFILST